MSQNDKVIWIIEENPRTGYRLIGQGEKCPVVRDQIAEKLGRIGKKVFLDRSICDPPEPKKGS